MDLEEAFEVATEILGYPCPCEKCSTDGGEGKSREIADLAYDLAGIEPMEVGRFPPRKPYPC